jgi:glycosyltransferase involved in cell wall biosynthesis
MIPTYNNHRFLGRTLESVLSQDPGPETMQIAVIDAGSTTGESKRIAEEVGAGRINYHRLSSNHGPPHTFNACIEQSRGHWIQILHDDDSVLPGFYDAYESIIGANPEVRTVVGQVIIVDEEDRWTGVSGLIPPVGGGAVPDFTDRLLTQQIAQFPGVVVHRGAYEAVGGFCTTFLHTCDWDMWFRLGQHAPVGCVPRPYARYRVHKDTETRRLQVSGENMRETCFVIRSNIARMGGLPARVDERAWRSHWATRCDETAWLLDRRGSTAGSFNQRRWALMLEPTLDRWRMVFRAWLKDRLRSHGSDARECAS